MMSHLDRQVIFRPPIITLRKTSNTTSRHRGPKCKRSWRTLASVITTLYYVAVLYGSLSCCECHIFHRRMWHRALSLRYAAIRR